MWEDVVIVGHFANQVPVSVLPLPVIQSFASSALDIPGNMNEPEVFVDDRMVRVANNSAYPIGVFFSDSLASGSVADRLFFHAGQYAHCVAEYTRSGITIVKDHAGDRAPDQTGFVGLVDSEGQVSFRVGNLAVLGEPLRCFQVAIAASAQAHPVIGTVSVDYVGRETFTASCRGPIIALPAATAPYSPTNFFTRFNRLDQIYANEQRVLLPANWIGGGSWGAPATPWTTPLTIWSHDDQTSVTRRSAVIDNFSSVVPIRIDCFLCPSPGSYMLLLAFSFTVPAQSAAYVDADTGLWFEQSLAGVLRQYRDGTEGHTSQILIGGPELLAAPSARFLVQASYPTPPPTSPAGIRIRYTTNEQRQSRVAP